MTTTENRPLRQPLCSRCFYFHALDAADPLLSGKGECWRFPPRSCTACLCEDAHPWTDGGSFCGEFVDRRDMVARFAPEVRQLYPVSARG